MNCIFWRLILMSHVSFINQKSSYRINTCVQIAEEYFALSMTLSKAILLTSKFVFFNLYYMIFLLTIMSLPSFFPEIKLFYERDISLYSNVLSVCFFGWPYMMGPDKTFITRVMCVNIRIPFLSKIELLEVRRN